jgi:hypothetical protein
MSVIAAIASVLRGEKFIHVDEESIAQKARIHGHHIRAHNGGEATYAPSLRDGEADEEGESSPGKLLGSALSRPAAHSTRK